MEEKPPVSKQIWKAVVCGLILSLLVLIFSNHAGYSATVKWWYLAGIVTYIYVGFLVLDYPRTHIGFLQSNWVKFIRIFTWIMAMVLLVSYGLNYWDKFQQFISQYIGDWLVIILNWPALVTGIVFIFLALMTDMEEPEY